MEAQRQISLNNASDFPYLKKEKRKEVLQVLNKTARPAILREEQELKSMTPEELMMLMNG